MLKYNTIPCHNFERFDAGNNTQKSNNNQHIADTHEVEEREIVVLLTSNQHLFISHERERATVQGDTDDLYKHEEPSNETFKPDTIMREIPSGPDEHNHEYLLDAVVQNETEVEEGQVGVSFEGGIGGHSKLHSHHKHIDYRYKVTKILEVIVE